MKLHETCTTDQAAPQFDHEWQRRAFGLALALVGVPALRLERVSGEPDRDDRRVGEHRPNPNGGNGSTTTTGSPRWTGSSMNTTS